MNLRNVSIYTSILLLVVGFGLVLGNVIQDLEGSSFATFSQASLEYNDKLYSGIYSNNLDNVTEQSKKNYQEDGMYLPEEDEGSSTITDVLASINFFKGLTQKIINPIKFIYNTPSFLLTVFGLPLEPFKPLTNIINLVFFIGMMSMIIINLK